ncbi:cytochrome P450 4C1-like [Centruroides sculpturatus]|uniref:cytochrome P450 4C1-like n=1 Tax=Centruroides sculpturatus TaxID=218467 RepID=UPI000C6E0CA3|nr:cytochrome P450 4C1-like [Centruroides sculpturatus]
MDNSKISVLLGTAKVRDLGRSSDGRERYLDEVEVRCGVLGDRRMHSTNLITTESMRIYPPAPFIARKNPSEMKIGNYVLPANSTLVISIYAIHHNPSVYENPEVFDPDRFLPENYKNLHPYAFLAFSAGPRNCLGNKLAMIKMKMVLANVLRNFKVYSLDPQDKIITSWDVMLTPISGIRMCVEKKMYVVRYKIT